LFGVAPPFSNSTRGPRRGRAATCMLWHHSSPRPASSGHWMSPLMGGDIHKNGKDQVAAR